MAEEESKVDLVKAAKELKAVEELKKLESPQKEMVINRVFHNYYNQIVKGEISVTYEKPGHSRVHLPGMSILVKPDQSWSIEKLGEQSFEVGLHNVCEKVQEICAQEKGAKKKLLQYYKALCKEQKVKPEKGKFTEKELVRLIEGVCPKPADLHVTL